MAIGRRFFDMARSELNSLLDKAAHLGEGDDDEGRKRDEDGLEAFSEAELEAELQRRRLDRELEERMANAAKRANTARPSQPPPRSSAPPRATHADKVARAYSALELPAGSDFATVKQQYRKLMRKYHPDHHNGSPEKEKAAHELTQKLTEAYKLLEKQLRGP